MRTIGEDAIKMISVLVFGFLLAVGATASFGEEGDHESHESQSGANQGMTGSPSGTSHRMGHMGTQMDHSGMQHGMLAACVSCSGAIGTCRTDRFRPSEPWAFFEGSRAPTVGHEARLLSLTTIGG
jgi:hypothetical protein